VEITEPALAEPPVERSRRQLGLGAVAALCLLSSIACLSLGYQLGRSANSGPDAPDAGQEQAGKIPPAPDTPALPKPDTPARPKPGPRTGTVVPSAPDPLPDLLPNAVPRDEVIPGKTSLLRFLEARDWTARRDLVLHSEHVAAQMKELAKSQADGPIKATRITPMHQTPRSSVFQVATESHPKGFPVAIARVDDRWLVDWASFAEFYYKRFQAFLTGNTETSGTFRVLIKPKLADLGDTGRQPYSASTPDMDRPATIFAAEDSPEYQALEDIIGALAAKAPVSFRKLMESGGVPLILDLSKTIEDGRPILMIQRVVDQGWSPQAPETP
jgi:hypothetical protein